MSLEITFNEEAFAKAEEPINHNPEFKKFNMKFHDLDLKIIDALAKRDGTSRSQILNMLIERILKEFLSNCGDDASYLMTDYADKLCDKSQKSDMDFTWSSWFIEERLNGDIELYLTVSGGINLQKHDNTLPESLNNIVSMIKKIESKSN